MINIIILNIIKEKKTTVNALTCTYNGNSPLDREASDRRDTIVAAGSYEHMDTLRLVQMERRKRPVDVGTLGVAENVQNTDELLT